MLVHRCWFGAVVQVFGKTLNGLGKTWWVGINNHIFAVPLVWKICKGFYTHQCLLTEQFTSIKLSLSLFIVFTWYLYQPSKIFASLSISYIIWNYKVHSEIHLKLYGLFGDTKCSLSLNSFRNIDFKNFGGKSIT